VIDVTLHRRGMGLRRCVGSVGTKQDDGFGPRCSRGGWARVCSIGIGLGDGAKIENITAGLRHRRTNSIRSRARCSAWPRSCCTGFTAPSGCESGAESPIPGPALILYTRRPARGLEACSRCDARVQQIGVSLSSPHKMLRFSQTQILPSGSNPLRPLDAGALSKGSSANIVASTSSGSSPLVSETP